MSELCFMRARELARLLRDREISALELLEAYLSQIEKLQTAVNAICTLVPDEARARARELDASMGRGEPAGLLHGLPIAVKDLELTKGIRTTFGSPIYENHVPDVDALFVERLKAAGAVIVGKTNTPELGAGSQTFNPLFGPTRNPYDLTKTCGGSSGGAAVAVACGMLPFADGSDLGGSVRNPPSFCNVFGLRPSPGRIPRWPNLDPWGSLPVLGPIARNVDDVALLLTALAGPDPRAPLSIAESGPFLDPVERELKGVHVAFSPDLGSFPVQKEVIEVLESAVARLAELGCEVERTHPDFRDAAETFDTLRAYSFAMAFQNELESHRDLMKDTVVWNIERGLALSAADVARAQVKRGELYERVRRFMERYDFLLLPVSQVVPFDVETKWVTEIEGVAMDTYIDWMKSCTFITLTSLPAMSVPAGFTGEGLPVGLQVVGRYRNERSVLAFARAFERETRYAERRPSIASGASAS